MATVINLPLYRALKSLNVPEAEAQAAAEAALPDLSRFATKEDLLRLPTKEDLSRFATKEDLLRFATKEDLLRFATKEDLLRLPTKEDLSRFATKEEVRAEVAGVRAEIAQAVQRQTTWLITVVFAAAGLVIAAQRLMPQALPADTVRAIVSQTVRDMQAVPTPPLPPR